MYADNRNLKPEVRKGQEFIFSPLQEGVSPSGSVYSTSLKPTINKSVVRTPFREFRSWLYSNDYSAIAGTIEACGTTGSMFTCGEHNYFTPHYCNSILCPTCGKKDSKAHRRRVRRAFDKLETFPCLGNVVLTLPESLKEIELKDFFRIAGRFIMEHFQTEACLGWFHPTGEKLTRHPHLQFLFPVERKNRYMQKDSIQELSRKWSDALREAFPELEIPERIMIHYCYEDTPGKITHAVKYVSRLAFITPEQFNLLGEDMKHYLCSLRKKRLVRGFGGFADRNLKTFLKERLESLPVRERRIETLEELLAIGGCPCCGQELHFHGVVHRRVFDHNETEELVPDVYVIKELAHDIREQWGLTEGEGVSSEVH